MSTAATVFQDAIMQVSKKFTYNKFEGRMSRYSVLQAFLDNAGMMLPESTIQKLRTAAVRTTKIPVLNAYEATLISQRSCTITPDEPTSAFKTMSWATIGFSVGITPSDSANNYIDAETNLAWQFEQGWRSVYSQLDSLGYQTLETNKTGVFPSPLYANANGAYQVPFTQKQDFYKNLPAVMLRHDFDGRIVDIANTEAMIDPVYLAAQGGQNGQNLQYQVGNIDFYRSNRVLTGADVLETHYNMPEGAIGIYNWNDWESQNKVTVHLGKGWDLISDPRYGLTWGVFYENDCQDGKFVKKWNIITDVSFLTAYSSNTDRAIIKSEILKPVVEA
ncbi:hypothetical protein [Pedobacter zeae]|uniref:Major capsid protein n=1 Tax=Pedobacter zeae TaxID=1737356 RepID=A0A7W6K9U2_9SPHI|nr:hypothetical protein [Pedobacter zeae]MBB4107740.1 hypothetical protein [Pedobacter zeae]GGG97367.1 hypothetical protein GCM10007422_09140 [Pedobacter zeae]